MTSSGSIEGLQSDRHSLAMIADLFGDEAVGSSETAWSLFVGLPDWSEREAVVQLLTNKDDNDKDTDDKDTSANNINCNPRTTSAFKNYKQRYRTAMTGIISDDFYTTSVKEWAEEYANKGEINVPFLDPGAFPALSAYAISIGNNELIT